MKIFTVILLLSSNISLAQSNSRQVASQFDKFALQPAIEWASYLVEPHFQDSNFNKILSNRYANNEINCSLPIILGLNHTDKLEYIKKESLDDDMLYPLIDPMIDSLGNAPAFDRYLYKEKIDSTLFTQMSITEILYIENKQLKSCKMFYFFSFF